MLITSNLTSHCSRSCGYLCQNTINVYITFHFIILFTIFAIIQVLIFIDSCIKIKQTAVTLKHSEHITVPHSSHLSPNPVLITFLHLLHVNELDLSSSLVIITIESFFPHDLQCRQNEAIRLKQLEHKSNLQISQ